MSAGQKYPGTLLQASYFPRSLCIWLLVLLFMLPYWRGKVSKEAKVTFNCQNNGSNPRVTTLSVYAYIPSLSSSSSTDTLPPK